MLTLDIPLVLHYFGTLGDILIIVGSLFGKRAKTNLIQILQVKEILEAKSKL